MIIVKLGKIGCNQVFLAVAVHLKTGMASLQYLPLVWLLLRLASFCEDQPCWYHDYQLCFCSSQPGYNSQALAWLWSFVASSFSLVVC